MTVRRRLLTSSLGFAAALALITSAQAQPPRDTRDPSTDDIKLRLEQYLNRTRGGGQPSAGMPPEFLRKMAEKFGPKAGPGKEGPDGPPEANPGGNKVEFDPGNKQQKGARPPFEFDPKGKEKLGPPTGIPGQNDPPRNPKDNVAPNQLPGRVEPRPEPNPRVPGKNDVAPDPARLGMPPPAVKEPNVELPAWQKPESPQDKARQAAAAVWEKSVGPLDETPAVKKALFDIVDGTGDLKGPDGEGLWDSLTKDMGGGKGFGDLFSGLDTGGDWNLGGGADWSFPKLNWNFNWGNNRPPDIGSAGPPRDSWFSKWRRSPSSSSSSSSSGSSWFSGWKAPRWNLGMPSLDGTWWPLLFVIAALVGGVFLWRMLARRGFDPMRIDPYALGPWPVDPHHLKTRQDVVVAFEHLSVLLCGEVAKTWTHTTIASALSEVALAEPERAMMLARLYELARYTPVDEPLTTAELAEARRLVCRLAGFSDD